jgi:hypothetical protein
MIDDIIFEIIFHLDTIEDLQHFCTQNKNIQHLCKNNKITISKHFLNKFHVNYTDPTNFIYLQNKTTIERYYTNNVWNYPSLFKLYMKHYYSKNINCKNLKITSFPVYPNMTHFNGSNNQLTSFPIQPNMTVFYGQFNQLTSFPIQPKMDFFYGQNNQLSRFPSQPNMIRFEGNSNQL